jgi:subtilisin family serine protease
MACPHVAGGAALILEENPGYGHSQVWHKLQMDAEIGVIKNLGADDQNKLLHIGR